MLHTSPTRWNVVQCGAAIAIDAMIGSQLLTGHHTTAGVLTVLAAIQLAWFAVVNARRESRLRTQLAAADTDPVTGLPTRRRLYRHLEAPGAGIAVTVAYLDVNGLKAVNDAWGHQVGDGLLQAVASRLSAACVPGDVLVHLGGDEYALATARDQYQLARALAGVNGATTVGDYQLPVSVSIGTSRVGGGDPQLALGSAEAAMYTAKRRHSGIEHYDPTRDGPPRLIRPLPQHTAGGRHRIHD